MILCDTNILIEIYKGNTTIVDIVKRIGQENIAISDVTRAELLFGARDKKELLTIKNDIENITIFPIDSEISSLAIEIIENYALSHRCSLPDALIAATAIVNKVQLYTLNIKDFKYLKDLSFYNMDSL
jgi:tRNA(fMet)-specific endonuclease VapC